MGPSWPTRREFSMGLILGLVLQRNQLTDEGVGERFERTGTVFGWERGGRADHELAQPGNSIRSAAWAGCKPNTGSTRPGASPAIDASCLATSTGWRPGSTEIPVPTFSRGVRDHADAMPVHGSTTGECTVSGS